MQNYPELESICKMIKTTLSDTEWGSTTNFLSIVSVILGGKLEASMQQKLEILQECLQGQSSWEKTFHDFSCLFPSLELDLANYKDFLEASLQYEMQSYNEFLCEMFPWLTPVKATDMQTMDAAQKFILQRNRLTIVQAEILQDSRHAIWNQIKDKIGLQIIPLGNCKEYLYNPYYGSEEKKLYDFSFWGGFRVVEGSNEEKMQEIKVVASLSHLAVLEKIAEPDAQCNIPEIMNELYEIHSYLMGAKERNFFFEQAAIKASVFQRKQKEVDSLPKFTVSEQFTDALRSVLDDPKVYINSEVLESFQKLEKILRSPIENPKLSDSPKPFSSHLSPFWEKDYQEKFILENFLNTLNGFYHEIGLRCAPDESSEKGKDPIRLFFKKLQFNRLQKKARIQELVQNITYGDIELFLASPLPGSLAYESKGRDMAELMSYLEDEKITPDFTIFGGNREALMTVLKFLHPDFSKYDLKSMASKYCSVISDMEEIFFSYIEVDQKGLSVYFQSEKDFFQFWNTSVVARSKFVREFLKTLRLKVMDKIEEIYRNYFSCSEDILIALLGLLVIIPFFLAEGLSIVFFFIAFLLRLPFFILATMYRNIEIVLEKTAGNHYTKEKFFLLAQSALNSYLDIGQLSYIDRFLLKHLVLEIDIYGSIVDEVFIKNFQQDNRE